MDKNEKEMKKGEGDITTLIGEYSHAEGYQTLSTGDFSHAEGVNTTSIGECSHSEGFFTTSMGDFSHAEGVNTKSIGECSHSEGFMTTSMGDFSHAEGVNTASIGECSHSEGFFSKSIGNYSHAEGYGAISLYDYSKSFSSSEKGQITEMVVNGYSLDRDNFYYLSNEPGYMKKPNKENKSVIKLDNLKTYFIEIKLLSEFNSYQLKSEILKIEIFIYKGNIQGYTVSSEFKNSIYKDIININLIDEHLIISSKQSKVYVEKSIAYLRILQLN